MCGCWKSMGASRGTGQQSCNKLSSVITWMKLYARADVEDVARFDAFMAEFGFAIIEIDAQIMQAAAMLASERRRTGRKIALPDALIAATAPCWATAENQR
jgi:predicted nucleic acid-binding protein